MSDETTQTTETTAPVTTENAPPIAPVIAPPESTSNQDAAIQQLLIAQRQSDDRYQQLQAHLERMTTAQPTAKADEFADPLAREIAETKAIIQKMAQEREYERTAFQNQQVLHSAVNDANGFCDRFAAAHPVTSVNGAAAEAAKNFVLGQVRETFAANPRAFVTPYQIQQSYNAYAANLGKIIAAQGTTAAQTTQAAIAAAVAKPSVVGGVAADPNAKPPPKLGSEEYWEQKKERSERFFAAQKLR